MYDDVSKPELILGLKRLKRVHSSNFGTEPLKPLVLLNKITKMNLESLFPNILIALRIFLTLPATVVN